uniref:Osteoclast-stimulating factor 1 n=1 Tax=Poecilia mexicana TaxID=48701 RepID=A0A3B3XII6_9TELE
MVLVEYEYDALHDDELTLRPGDIIKNVRYIEEEGWMEGDLNGKRGVFPDNFVKELKKDPKEVKETRNEPKEEPGQPQGRESSVANLVKRISVIGIPTGGFQPMPPAASKKPKRRQCKVLFDYQPVNEDELELKVGDVVDILEEVEEGWWSGSLNGRSGLFPSNFVKELEAGGEEAEANDTAADKPDGSGTEPAATPTTPQPDSGNGATHQPRRIIGVGFGDIFKGGPVKLRTQPSPITEDRKPVPSLPSAAKPAHPNMTDSQRAEVDAPTAKEFCKVKYAYDGKNEDELSLKEGELVHILSKDTGEPGWWRGEIGGRDGVFPNNFVTVVPEAEKEVRHLIPSAPSTLLPSHGHTPEPKLHKPPAPNPPKKPVPIPPKKPEKPIGPSLKTFHVELILSGIFFFSSSPLLLPPPPEDLMSFDELSSASEKLSHLTTSRPKVTGRRLPGQFAGGQSPSNQSPPPHRPGFTEPKPGPAAAAGLDVSISQNSRAHLEMVEQSAQQDELKSQIKDLLLSVELLKAQQM